MVNPEQREAWFIGRQGQSMIPRTLMTIIIAVLIGMALLFFIFKLRGSLG